MREIYEIHPCDDDSYTKLPNYVGIDESYMREQERADMRIALTTDSIRKNAQALRDRLSVTAPKKKKNKKK